DLSLVRDESASSVRPIQLFQPTARELVATRGGTPLHARLSDVRQSDLIIVLEGEAVVLAFVFRDLKDLHRLGSIVVGRVREREGRNLAVPAAHEGVVLRRGGARRQREG